MSKRRFLAFVVLFSMILQAFAPINVQASKKKDAYSVYYKLIKDLHEKGDDEFGVRYENFKLIYIDKDSVPELLANYDDGYGIRGCAVYTFNGKKAVKLKRFEYPSAGGYVNVGYIKKSGKLYESYYSTGGDAEDTVYKIKKGKLAQEAYGEFKIGNDSSYKWNGKSVSEKTYNKKFKKAFNWDKAIYFYDIKTISYSKMRRQLKGKENSISKGYCSHSGNLIGTAGGESCVTGEIEESSGWKKAYRKVVSKFEKRENYLTDEKFYRLVYVNGDKIPELVCSNGPTDSVYTYKNGKAVLLLESGSGASGDMGRYYIPKKNIMYEMDSDFAGLFVGYYGVKIKNGKVKKAFTLYETCFKDKNGNKKLDDNEIDESNVREDGKYKYYKNKKLISKKRFKKIIKGSKLLKGNVTADKILKKL